jgi:NAD(P)-dependent dehydrogenase (short-subunit alcohol dehydrogenase family)
VALVTGSARRLGQALVLHLAERDHDVIVHYRSSAAEAEETVLLARSQGVRAEMLRADLASVEEIEGLFGEIADLFGRLDVLVNNASAFFRTRFLECRESDFDELIDSNLKGPFFCCQFATALMQQDGGGQILNLVDVSTDRPWPDYLPYCAAKSGLVSLTKGLARALAPDIRVNAIAPGPVLFPEHLSREQKQRVIEETLLQRAGSPADVVAAADFLLFGSDYLTGAILPVDGGRSLA